RLAREVTAASDGLYRHEAVTAFQTANAPTTPLLVTYPTWLRLSVRAVIAAFVVFMALAVVFPLPEYATAPAVIRTGAAGAPTATALTNEGPYEVVAFVPAQYSSQLQPGISMIVRLHGSKIVQRLAVEAVGPRVETRAGLRGYGGDTLRWSDPVIVVRSRW